MADTLVKNYLSEMKERLCDVCCEVNEYYGELLPYSRVFDIEDCLMRPLLQETVDSLFYLDDHQIDETLVRKVLPLLEGRKELNEMNDGDEDKFLMIRSLILFFAAYLAKNNVPKDLFEEIVSLLPYFVFDCDYTFEFEIEDNKFENALAFLENEHRLGLSTPKRGRATTDLQDRIITAMARTNESFIRFSMTDKQSAAYKRFSTALR
ncbi:MAG: hypothetical protein SGARI_005615 [Bacillariaceae sp.]